MAQYNVLMYVLFIETAPSLLCTLTTGQHHAGTPYGAPCPVGVVRVLLRQLSSRIFPKTVYLLFYPRLLSLTPTCSVCRAALWTEFYEVRMPISTKTKPLTSYLGNFQVLALGERMAIVSAVLC